MALKLAPAAAPAADPATKVAELVASITAAKAVLRRALLDGGSTADVRARLAGLERDLADARAAVAEERDRAAATDAAELRAAGDMLAKAAAGRIEAILQPLQPPAAP